jgi:glycosyltransferase involved in cell wall biosynthesis
MSNHKNSTVLLLDHFDRWGGAQLFILDLLPLLAKSVKRVWVTKPLDGSISKELSAIAGLHQFEEFPYLLKSKIGISTFRDIKRISTQIPQSCNLIANSIPGLLTGAFIRSSTRPLVFISHLVDLNALQRFVIHYAKPDHIVTVSEFAKEYLNRNGFGNYDISVVYNGFRFPEREDSGPFNENDSAEILTIGLVGRIEKEKGALDFIELAYRLRDIDQLRFRFVGECRSPVLMNQILNEVKKLGIDQKIEFTGLIGSVDKCYEGLNMVLNLSKIRESFGRTIVEAAMYGLPALSYKNGGPEEIIEHELTGELADNLVDIEKSIRKLFNQPELMRKYSKTAYDRALHRFDIEKTIGQLLSILRS